jgi:hypothetical protein
MMTMQSVYISPLLAQGQPESSAQLPPRLWEPESH